MAKDNRSEDELRIARFMGEALKSRKSARNTGVGCGSGCLGMLLAYLIIGIFIGGVMVRYDLSTLFGLHPPLWASCIGGMFLWGIAFPVAIIVKLCEMGGAHSPIFHLGMVFLSTFRI